MKITKYSSKEEKILYNIYTYSKYKAISHQELIDLGFDENILKGNDVIKIGGFKLFKLEEQGRQENFYYITRFDLSSQN